MSSPHATPSSRFVLPLAFRRGFAACVAAAAVAMTSAPAKAASVERELGDGAMYVRVHEVPADLPTAEGSRKHPCILDLRYAHGTSEAGTVLASWLKFHAADHDPVFVLVNGGTAAPLLRALDNRDRTAGLIVVGVAAQRFEPDIAVRQSSAAERRAYDALEKGATITALTTDNPDKQRNDEASLSQDRSPEPTDDGDDEPAEPPEQSPAVAKTPPIDAALQMALHLEQGLRAMKRI